MKKYLRIKVGKRAVYDEKYGGWTHGYDSGFWVQVNLPNLKKTREQLLACTRKCPIAWFTGVWVLLICNAVFGGMVP